MVAVVKVVTTGFLLIVVALVVVVDDVEVFPGGHSRVPPGFC